MDDELPQAGPVETQTGKDVKATVDEGLVPLPQRPTEEPKVVVDEREEEVDDDAEETLEENDDRLNGAPETVVVDTLSAKDVERVVNVVVQGVVREQLPGIVQAAVEAAVKRVERGMATLGTQVETQSNRLDTVESGWKSTNSNVMKQGDAVGTLEKTVKNYQQVVEATQQQIVSKVDVVCGSIETIRDKVEELLRRPVAPPPPRMPVVADGCGREAGKEGKERKVHRHRSRDATENERGGSAKKVVQLLEAGEDEARRRRREERAKHREGGHESRRSSSGRRHRSESRGGSWFSSRAK
ncbi:hypothetical protein MAJ_11109, partial [Metarhizium majus ARSEF 297]